MNVHLPNEMYERAARRKSPWNLILVPACFGTAILIGFGLFGIIWKYHTTLYPNHELKDFWRSGNHGRPELLSFLMVTPLCPGSLLLGFYLGNILVWFIPPARRAFESEAIGHNGADFKSAQRTLFSVA